MSLNAFGKTLNKTGAMRLYKDGDLTLFVWRWWHPVSWVMLPILILISILASGIPETFKDPHMLGLCVNPYFKENNLPIKWL